jgi:hypothetical protein
VRCHAVRQPVCLYLLITLRLEHSLAHAAYSVCSSALLTALVHSTLLLTHTNALAKQCVHEDPNQGKRSRTDLALVSQPLAQRATCYVLPVRQHEEATAPTPMPHPLGPYIDDDIPPEIRYRSYEHFEVPPQHWNIGKWSGSDHSPIWLTLQPPAPGSTTAAAAAGTASSGYRAAGSSSCGSSGGSSGYTVATEAGGSYSV